MAKASKEALSVREKIALHILALMLKIVSPFEYSHELTNALKPIDELVKRGVDG